MLKQFYRFLSEKLSWFTCSIKHCYQRIDLPVKKGPLLIYGCVADLLYILLNTYLCLLVYTNKRRYVFKEHKYNTIRFYSEKNVKGQQRIHK